MDSPTFGPWERNDLTAIGWGRGLVIRWPRVALTWWPDGTYTMTDPTAVTTTGMTLAAVVDWCKGVGASPPPPDDLAWLIGGAS